MSKDLFFRLDDALNTLIMQMYRLEKEGSASHFHFATPNDSTHGDLSSNAAMMLAKSQRRRPLELAEEIAVCLRTWSEFASVSVVSPGFINIHLDPSALVGELERILAHPDTFSHSNIGNQEKVIVEYVSVNPTGPLHVGHARGAVFGDTLSGLLKRIGYQVTREYYVNDAGVQVDTLARSVYGRYLQALGDETQKFEAPLYPGEYLIPVGEALVEKYGSAFQGQPESEWLSIIRDFSIVEMMDLIRRDLASLGVHQDVFTSERSLVESGVVEQTLEDMRAHDLVYQGVLEPPKGKLPEDWEPREQLLFRSTAFGDDIDRPLVKSDGSWSYFTPDIAYHRHKAERGFDWMINVFGADHIGYVKRLKASVSALSPRVRFDILCVQIVRFMSAGEALRMSKRSGTFVSLSELVETVGKDVVRLHLMGRKNDAHMDFDLKKIQEQSMDNPVFYIQYAHARCHSAIKHAGEVFPAILKKIASYQGLSACLTRPADVKLMAKIAEYPNMLRRAGCALEVHRIALYLKELAKELHSYWNQGRDEAELRVVVRDDPELTHARCLLLQGVQLVLAEGLELLGVQAVDELR